MLLRQDPGSGAQEGLLGTLLPGGCGLTLSITAISLIEETTIHVAPQSGTWLPSAKPSEAVLCR